jgi:hypothetical protein
MSGLARDRDKTWTASSWLARDRDKTWTESSWLARDRDKRRVLVNALMTFLMSQNARNFVTI